MLRVLIIGSEGFIGSNLATFYRNKGADVDCADIVGQPAESYFVINSSRPDFDGLFAKKLYDLCINASGAANVQRSFESPIIDFELNVLNVFKILDAVRKYNPTCKFINISSAAVYGDPQNLPIREVDNLSPVSPYGFHKVYSEKIVEEFYTVFHVPGISIRVFSAYGEGLRKQLFWDLFNKVQNSKDGQIEIYGSGRESRDFIYIKDVLSAIDVCVQSSPFEGEVVNVASGREILIEHAVATFVELTGSGVSIRFNNIKKVGDPINWKADISKLQGWGFEPRYTIESGLKNTVAWLKSNQKKSS